MQLFSRRSPIVARLMGLDWPRRLWFWPSASPRPLPILNAFFAASLFHVNRASVTGSEAHHGQAIHRQMQMLPPSAMAANIHETISTTSVAPSTLDRHPYPYSSRFNKTITFAVHSPH